MPAIGNENSFQLLKQYMGIGVQGPIVDSLLEAIAVGDDLNAENIRAIFDQLFLSTASGDYLVRRAGDVGFLRPTGVGLKDSTFRRLAILTTANKQVTSVLLEILEVFYTPENTRALMEGAGVEPFALQDGDTLQVVIDGTEATLTFPEEGFTNIAAATAAEVVFSITRQLRNLGTDAFALESLNPTTGDRSIKIFSGARGTTGSVQVVGGRAQNELQFPTAVLTTQTATAPATQWQIQVQPGGEVRMLWVGGTDPSLEAIEIGDYVNIYGTSFDTSNRGSFEVADLDDGAVGVGYVEFRSDFAVNETVSMAADDDVVFWRPTLRTVLSSKRYSTIFDVEDSRISAFLPATTTVTERELTEAAYLHGSYTAEEFLGPYIFSPASKFTIAEVASTLTQTIDAGRSYQIIDVAGSLDFPDDTGYLIFGFGTSREEGPVRYLARPGSSALLLDPSYIFTNSFEVGDDVALVQSRGATSLASDGSDYQFYLTGTSPGRLYAETLLGEVAAAGINLDVTVLYPGDIGLGNAGEGDTGDKVSDKVYIWGGDPV